MASPATRTSACSLSLSRSRSLGGWFPRFSGGPLLLTLLAALAACGPARGQQIVAHRGASHDAPENTLAAFHLAWEQGADGIEGDFYFTRDRQIVCIHDANTERTAGTKRAVAASTLNQLRELEYGAWKGKRFSGEPLPTFGDVLACVPAGKLFVIELKTGPEIVPLLKAELSRGETAHKRLLIISFQAATIKACKHHLPEIRAHWLTGYRRDKQTGAWSPSAAEILRTLKETGADGLGTKGVREVVTPAFVRSLKQGGLREFHVWTIDDLDDARYYRSLGAIGITTNRPAVIRQGLAAGGNGRQK